MSLRHSAFCWWIMAHEAAAAAEELPHYDEWLAGWLAWWFFCSESRAVWITIISAKNRTCSRFEFLINWTWILPSLVAVVLLRVKRVSVEHFTICLPTRRGFHWVPAAVTIIFSPWPFETRSEVVFLHGGGRMRRRTREEPYWRFSSPLTHILCGDYFNFLLLMNHWIPLFFFSCCLCVSERSIPNI